MIPFKTKFGSFEIPSTWNDLTMDDLNFIKSNIDDDIKIAERITKLSIEQLSKINIEPIRSVLDELFSVQVKDIEPKIYISLENGDFELPADIRLKTWYQKLEAFKAYQNNNHELVLSIYLEPIMRGKKKPKPDKIEVLSKSFGSLSVWEFYSSYNFIEKQIEDLIKAENNMPKPEVTPEQIDAGAESFNVLGDFNTIDIITQGKIWKQDKVLMLPYIVIYKKLYRNNLNTIFDTKYSEIMTAKANTPKP